MTSVPPDTPDWVTSVGTIDSPLIIDSSQTFVGVPVTGPVVDVSLFASIVLRVTSIGVDATDVLVVTVSWQNNGAPVGSDVFTKWGNGVTTSPAPNLDVTIPCRGNQVQVSVTSVNGSQDAFYEVIGSKRTVSDITIKDDELGVAPALVADATTSIAAGATKTYHCGPTHGPISFSVTLAGTNNTLVIFAQVVHAGVLVPVRIFSSSFTNNLAPVTLFCPGMALDVEVKNTTAAAATVSIYVAAERQ